MALDFSPATNNVISMLKNGTAFDTSLLGNIGSVGSRMSAISERLHSMGLTNEAATLSSMNTGPMTSLLGHVTNQFSDVTRNLSIASSYIGMLQAAGAAGEDPCGPITDFFGSIMGQAESFMNQINNVLTQIDSMIAGAIGMAIAAPLAILGGIMSQIDNMIQTEIAKIEEAIKELSIVAAALNLFNLWQNSCAKRLLDVAGSTGLLENLNI